ncbi:hypothetical protein AAH994_00515 [Weeksellaceae bacterium A-14]
MNKKFILSLAILCVLVSCRESEQIMDYEKTNVNEIIKSKTQSKDDNNLLKENYTVAKDSIESSATLEEDPPIKYGGHWKQ